MIFPHQVRLETPSPTRVNNQKEPAKQIARDPGMILTALTCNHDMKLDLNRREFIGRTVGVTTALLALDQQGALGVAAPVDGSASLQKSHEWTQTCRPHLEWVNWDPNFDVESYADALVARARQLNSDMLVYPWESGGYALYPTELAPPYEHLHGRDLIGTLELKAHAADLRFGICLLGQSGNTYLPSVKPDWVMHDRNDQPVGQWHGYNFRSLCPNSPYTTYLHDITTELLQRYCVDALYLEGIYVGSGFCRCRYCLGSFRQDYGRELPKDKLDDDPDYQRYRQDSFARPFQALRRAIDSISPSTAFFGGLGYTYYFGKQGDDVRRVAPLVDVVCIEAQWNYDLPQGYDPGWAPTLPEVGLMMQCLRAEGRKPMLGTVWIAKHVDQNYAPRTAANVILNFAELLAQGAIPQVHTQNALEVDARHLPTLRRLYADAGKALPYLRDSYVVSHVALLDWACLDRPAEYFDRAFRGAYKAMMEAHLPVRIVTVEQLTDSLLALTPSRGGFNVLLLANALNMDDATVSRIEQYVRAGGGLVMTYQTITRNPRLAELAGIRHVASRRKADGEFPLHTYYRLDTQDAAFHGLAGQLRSFQGSYEAVECQGDTRSLGQILGFDDTRRSDQHILQTCWPGQPISPAMTLRALGKGRVVYIAPDLDAAARRYGDPDSLKVLAATVRCAGNGVIPIQVIAPPSVEIVTHRSPKRLVVMLVNHTTNQHQSDPIRYVVTVSDVRISIAEVPHKPRRVQTVSGAKVSSTLRDRQLQLHLPKLAEYESILVDL